MPSKSPLSTYRLQFNRKFTFQDATEQIPYLHRLGIDWLYASPYLQARSGSMHGYDISDHNRLNPEIGTPEEHAAMIRLLREHDMGHLLDIVPNHMGIGQPDNRWWMDVLENGPSSLYAPFFDIDWEASARGVRGKVTLPVLGDQYGKVLEAEHVLLRTAPGSTGGDFAAAPDGSSTAAWFTGSDSAPPVLQIQHARPDGTVGPPLDGLEISERSVCETGHQRPEPFVILGLGRRRERAEGAAVVLPAAVDRHDVGVVERGEDLAFAAAEIGGDLDRCSPSSLASRARNATVLVRGRPSDQLPSDPRERAAVAALLG